MDNSRKIIGRLISGGVHQHLLAELENCTSEQISISSMVIIKGESLEFIATVADLAYLPPPDPDFIIQPLRKRLPRNLAARIDRSVNRSAAELMLNLTIESSPDKGRQLSPATSLPVIHSPVCLAGEADIDLLFGDKNDPAHFVIGYTREQGYPIAIDLRRLLLRSSGLFGASGSGKSSLTRVVLCGMIKSGLAATLVFDLHDEYGFDDTSTDTGEIVPGLKTVFPDRVKSYALGKNARVRGQAPDQCLVIGLTEIKPRDILALASELNLLDTSAVVCSALYKSFKERWLADFLRMNRDDDVENEKGKKIPAPGSVSEWCNRTKVNRLSAEALHSKLVNRIGRLPYVSDSAEASGIQSMLAALRSGQHVTLSFANNDSDLDFTLAGNLITRIISSAWKSSAEAYRNTHVNEPKPLLIVLEESHKYLKKDSESIMGEIAKEARKAYVVLLLIDQRPSQIWDEVMSQITTRFCGWLGDEADIKAIVSGLPGQDSLKKIMASLRQSGQAMLVGWAAPVPISFNTRRYDASFVAEVKQPAAGSGKSKSG